MDFALSSQNEFRWRKGLPLLLHIAIMTSHHTTARGGVGVGGGLGTGEVGVRLWPFRVTTLTELATKSWVRLKIFWVVSDFTRQYDSSGVCQVGWPRLPPQCRVPNAVMALGLSAGQSTLADCPCIVLRQEISPKPRVRSVSPSQNTTSTNTQDARQKCKEQVSSS